MVFYYKFLDPNMERNEIDIDRTRVYTQISDLQEEINASIGFFDCLEVNEKGVGSDEDYDLEGALGEINLLCKKEEYRDQEDDDDED